MKIVSYNLHYGGHTRQDNHWERILKFNPDFVLAQESFNPEKYLPKGDFNSIARSVIWHPTGSEWGSAILSTRHELDPFQIPKEFEGWVVGGKIADFSIGGSPRPLNVFSVHTPSPGPYEKKVHDILDYIQEITRDSDCDLIIGGDFNITTAVRHPTEGLENEGLKNTKVELAIIDRLRKKFGLINSWQAVHPNRSLPQTLRWTGNKNEPYHCDGIFIPHSWLRHLESCEVVATDGWSEMSDHNPIVATFNVQPES
jgi:exonuclease III